MDPDEMDEFERWQAEQLDLELQQQMGGWEDMEDPAEVQLCEAFIENGACSAGDECPYIHGDQCKVSKGAGQGSRCGCCVVMKGLGTQRARLGNCTVKLPLLL
jgi:hypothetical protein